MKQLHHMSFLLSIVYFYRSTAYEQSNDYLSIRQELMETYRLSCIHNQETLQAMIYNLILRNYLHYNHYEASIHFLKKTSFPESVQNNELVKYLFYSAKIKSIQMDYQGAYSNLLQAMRKSPDQCATGFKCSVYKLIIINELLLGEIPTRSLFQNPIYKKQLEPYYEVAYSVLKGDANSFKIILQKNQNLFVKDKLNNLIQRLQYTVIATGLKRINSAYSRISLQDIRKKLGLNDDVDVEFVVAKGIRDGVISGKINRELQCLEVEIGKQMYFTEEPRIQLEKRIRYTFNLNNNASLQFKNQFSYNQRDKQEEDNLDDLFQLVDDEFDF